MVFLCLFVVFDFLLLSCLLNCCIVSILFYIGLLLLSIGYVRMRLSLAIFRFGLVVSFVGHVSLWGLVYINNDF